MSEWNQLIDTLKNHGVEFATPLTEAETVAVENRFHFTFPVDLREFLQTGLPTGGLFPGWRSKDYDHLSDWINQPREGILFDVEHNNFWLKEWGPRPYDLEIANGIANKLIDDAPTLIPLYGHRMIPSEPTTAGNPIFSVHQTDIIVYGINLTAYFVVEFQFTEEEIKGLNIPQEECTIRFWDEDRFQTR